MLMITFIHWKLYENQTATSGTIFVPLLQSIIGGGGVIEIPPELFQESDNRFDSNSLIQWISGRREHNPAHYVVVSFEKLTKRHNKMLVCLANDGYMKLNNLKLLCLTDSKEIVFSKRQRVRHLHCPTSNTASTQTCQALPSLLATPSVHSVYWS